MVSRNYNVHADKGITLNAKSPNDNRPTKPVQNNKTKQSIHYKQVSVGTQYSFSQTQHAAPKTDKTSPIPTYTPTINQDLSSNVDLKSIKPIGDSVATFTFVPIGKEPPIYSECTKRNNRVETPYLRNVSTFTNNVEAHPKAKANYNNNNNSPTNLPTIAESIVEDVEYAVDVGRRCDFGVKAAKCMTNVAIRNGSTVNSDIFDNSKQEEYCREHCARTGRLRCSRTLESNEKDARNRYQGSHPDSLCRVPMSGTSWGRSSAASRLRGPCRLLKWPLALAALCVSLALLVYFLMPDGSQSDLGYDEVNSTEWLREDEQTFKRQGSNESKAKGSFSDNNSIEPGGERSADKGSSPAESVTDDDKETFHFGYIEGETDEELEKFVELLPKLEAEVNENLKSSVKNSQMTPSPPVFPTNISPSVQYGNEHQDDGSNEKRTPKKPIISVQPVTDIYDDRFLTQTFAIFYNREATESTESTESSEKPKTKGEQSAPSFTSGHQNSFGIPIEEAERMKSTTQAAIYNTKVSPTLPSVTGNNRVRSTTVRSRWNTTEDGICHSTRLSMCRGVLPYDLTTLPLVTGISNFQELDAAVPYFDYILRSGCSPRSRQFICSLLEPECKPKGMKILPPCRRACKAIAESCQEVIAGTLELSQVFNCQQYPEQESECVTLARGAQCLTGELRCPQDGSCVPLHWRCDNISDCPGGTDEQNCDDLSCAPAEFRCGGRGTCIPEEWVCDGHQDCPGAEDEASCGTTGEADVVSAASYHPRPARVPRPRLRPQPLPGSSIYTVTSKSTPEYESSKELLMMSDSVMPVIKPISSLTSRKKPTTVTSTTPRVYQVTSSSSSISVFQPSPCPKYDPNCKRTKYGTARPPICPPGMNCTTDQKKNEGTSTTTTTSKTTTSGTENTNADRYTDETEGGNSGTSHSSPCPLGELRCVDGRCITFSQLCDRHVDCTDGADEANCFT